jgi:light-regulated signal transduction histidine kinase (bacteriophytochrome)
MNPIGWLAVGAVTAGGVLWSARHVRALARRTSQLEAEVRKNAQLEARLRGRTAELESANRELEAFSYSISHDLRAPLRTISGFCRILETDHGAELSPEARRYVTLVHGGATHMARLIDDLLSLSRLGRQAIEWRPCDASELVRDALADLQGDLEGRAVEWRLQPLPRVTTDPRLLRQVFLNLLSNAIKFTKGRSPAVIEVACADDAAGVSVFSVRDNGVGFDMAYSGGMFRVFQRLHPADAYEGTGVGLAIVHRAISRLGGRVWAEGAPDRGATVYFTIGAQPETS